MWLQHLREGRAGLGGLDEAAVDAAHHLDGGVAGAELPELDQGDAADLDVVPLRARHLGVGVRLDLVGRPQVVDGGDAEAGDGGGVGVAELELVGAVDDSAAQRRAVRGDVGRIRAGDVAEVVGRREPDQLLAELLVVLGVCHAAEPIQRSGTNR